MDGLTDLHCHVDANFIFQQVKHSAWWSINMVSQATYHAAGHDSIMSVRGVLVLEVDVLGQPGFGNNGPTMPDN